MWAVSCYCARLGGGLRTAPASDYPPPGGGGEQWGFSPPPREMQGSPIALRRSLFLCWLGGGGFALAGSDFVGEPAVDFIRNPSDPAGTDIDGLGEFSALR